LLFFGVRFIGAATSQSARDCIGLDKEEERKQYANKVGADGWTLLHALDARKGREKEYAVGG
jgi:hypothetical protein